MSDWNCPVCDRDFEDEAEMDDGICRKCAAYTSKTQSACAAGSWRTDVENAQFTEGQEYLIEYTHPWYPTEPAANYRGTVFYVAEHDHFTHPCHGIITRDRLRTFATINRPEIPNDHP